MSFNVSYIYTLVDRFSAPARKMGKGRLMIKVSANQRHGKNKQNLGQFDIFATMYHCAMPEEQINHVLKSQVLPCPGCNCSV